MIILHMLRNIHLNINFLIKKKKMNSTAKFIIGDNPNYILNKKLLKNFAEN